MNLNDWIKAKRGRNTAIAALCGVDCAAVSNWTINRHAVPLYAACLIEEFSDCVVRVEEMLPKYAEQIKYLRGTNNA